jgi:hypothetical protein
LGEQALRGVSLPPKNPSSELPCGDIFKNNLSFTFCIEKLQGLNFKLAPTSIKPEVGTGLSSERLRAARAAASDE